MVLWKEKKKKKSPDVTFLEGPENLSVGFMVNHVTIQEDNEVHTYL